MKRPLPPLLLAVYIGLGIFLVVSMWRNPEPRHVIHPSSKYAIIQVDDDAMVRDILEGRIQIKSNDPDAKTLIRVNSGNPSRIYGNLKSDGSVYLINPRGVIVGQDAVIDLDAKDPAPDTVLEIPGPEEISTLPGGSIKIGNSLETSSGSGDDSAEMQSHGNVYALKIRKDGRIRATPVNRKSTLDQKP